MACRAFLARQAFCACGTCGKGLVMEFATSLCMCGGLSTSFYATERSGNAPNPAKVTCLKTKGAGKKSPCILARCKSPGHRCGRIFERDQAPFAEIKTCHFGGIGAGNPKTVLEGRDAAQRSQWGNVRRAADAFSVGKMRGLSTRKTVPRPVLTGSFRAFCGDAIPARLPPRRAGAQVLPCWPTWTAPSTSLRLPSAAIQRAPARSGWL